MDVGYRLEADIQPERRPPAHIEDLEVVAEAVGDGIEMPAENTPALATKVIDGPISGRILDIQHS